MLRPFPSSTNRAAAVAVAVAPCPPAMPHPSSSASSRSTGGAGGGGHQVPSVYPPAAPACRHTPSSATLDLLILLLVLFSVAFLLGSSLAHVSRSLSPLLASPPAAAVIAAGSAAMPYLGAAAALAWATFLSCGRLPRRRCRNPRCRGLVKALEFDVQLQTEESVRAGTGSSGGGGGGTGADAAMWREIEALPWKGGQGGNNPDYECLRAELRRMAPPNGRAVLLFRNRCGCPIAKLEGWGVPKSKRRSKRNTLGLPADGGVR
ncbi:uncharacterized protein At5g19025-like [Oryza brachyantha]|uniref:uncharacterized protein At5g19025-like n=1 Tax=Oryza brachyantha TaxID=4533 RepID=UPI001AD989AF|nr:uncharacterized protein At5g19025-like [Oryza brachyantha]